MAEDGLKTLKEFDIIYFGAVGFPSMPDHISLRGLRLPICQGFEQYVCQRPSYLLPGIKSPLADKKPGDIDFVVIRENTEASTPARVDARIAACRLKSRIETSVFTRVGVERIIRYAYQLAQSRRKKLVNATKSNAQQHSLHVLGRDFCRGGQTISRGTKPSAC